MLNVSEYLMIFVLVLIGKLCINGLKHILNDRNAFKKSDALGALFIFDLIKSIRLYQNISKAI